MSGVSCADQTPSFEKTWGSSTSSGYCSEEDSDSELEQYFTARTSFFRKPQKEKEKLSEKVSLCKVHTPSVRLSAPRGSLVHLKIFCYIVEKEF